MLHTRTDMYNQQMNGRYSSLCSNSIEQIAPELQRFCESSNLKDRRALNAVFQTPTVQEIRCRLIVETFCLIDLIAIKWMRKGQLGQWRAIKSPFRWAALLIGVMLCSEEKRCHQLGRTSSSLHRVLSSSYPPISWRRQSGRKGYVKKVEEKWK